MGAETFRTANHALIGMPSSRAALQTPALVVDLDLLERNLALVTEHCRRAGKALRPHVKGHKCPDLARRQVAAGAIGLSCTTLAEAELMVDSGAPSLLITSTMVDPGRTGRLASLIRRVPEVIAVVDDEAALAGLAQSAASANAQLRVLVDLDVGQHRTGISVADTRRIVALAMAIEQTPGLIFNGLQAYYGHLQGVPEFAERAALARARQAELRSVIDVLTEAGLPPRIVSGGGTGTLLVDTDKSPFTELQPGSYPFLDLQYGGEALTPDQRLWLSASLFVRGRVISTNQPDRVTVDIGMKAIATDAGPPALRDPAEFAADYMFAGDEHGFLMISPAGERPALGSTVELIPGHCDTTVNLHAVIHAVRDQVLEAIWPIGARGVW